MLAKGAVAEPADALTPEQAIKDPFVLEFLNLKDEYSESIWKTRCAWRQREIVG